MASAGAGSERSARDVGFGGRGISLARIGGIDVRLDYSWFFVFLLIWVSLSLGYFPRSAPDETTAAYWVAGAVATLLFFLSILVHEMSHAVVARLAGIRVPAITLFLFGGVSHMEEEAREPAVELRIAIVGPFTSFALAGLFWGAHQALVGSGAPVLALGVVQYLAWINLALGVFNLLPGYPLDGGRVLRALAWWRTGSERRATRIAANAGKGLAIGIMLLGGLQILAGALIGGFWLVFIGMFLRSMAEAGYQNLVLRQTLHDVTAGDVAVHDPVSVGPDLPIQRLVDDYLLVHGHHSYPVVADGRVEGLVAVSDLQGLAPEKRETTRVRERMRALGPELVISPETPLTDALPRLARVPGGRLLVVREGGRLVGLLTRSTLARYVEIRQALEAPAT